jgi:hypothetical protein
MQANELGSIQKSYAQRFEEIENSEKYKAMLLKKRPELKDDPGKLNIYLESAARRLLEYNDRHKESSIQVGPNKLT